MRVAFALVALLATSAFAGPTPALRACHICDSSAATPPAPAVVQAVLFYSTGCGHCIQVLNQTLPELQSRFGAQLQVTLVSLEDQSAYDRLYAVAQELGLAKESVAIPFMIVDRTVLIGSREIPERMPGLIEAGLASGGIAFPSLGSLEGLASGELFRAQATPAPTPTSPPAVQPPDPIGPEASGFGLAWGVMVLLVAAVLFAVYGFIGGPLPQWPSLRDGRSFFIAALTLLGMVIAGYMTYVEVARVSAFCGPIGDCNTVQTSRYAKLFGLIPMAIFGMAGYVAIFVGWAWPRLRRDGLARVAPLLVFAATLFGVLFSVYLTYVEIFVLRAVCAWCLGNAVVMASLLVVATPAALRALEPAEADD